MLYLEIFNRKYINRYPVTGVSIPRDLDYLRSTYEFNKTLIMDYYLNRNFAVKNTHILSRLVELLPLMLDTDVYDFLPVSEDRVEYLSRELEITSGINKGIVHPPHFFGNGGNDILINDERWRSPSKLESEWETYSCLTTLTHERNDLNLLLPTGLNDGCKSGLGSVAIDVVALNIKYREFIKEQMSNLESGYSGSILGKNHFIIKYVLPGIMESYIDHVFMNRLMDKFYGNDIITPKHKHKVILRQAETQVDRFVDNILDTITNKDIDFVNIMNNIPLMFSPNASILLSFEHMPNTRQSNWFFLISRLKHMCFLYDVSKNVGRSKNFIVDWKRLVTRLENDKAIINGFTYSVQKEINGYIAKIKDM